MAGRVSNTHEEHAVVTLCQLERFLIPHLPSNWIFHVPFDLLFPQVSL